MPSLDNLVIVVTRPARQADNLCELLQDRGATALRFPVMEITDPTDTQTLNETVSTIADANMAIFISPNAVEYGLKAITAQTTFPATIKLAAVGETTAKRLAEQARPADIFPKEKFNSEALLAMDEMQFVQDQQIVIFRGVGGRELLADTLKQRGANVVYAECYERLRPPTPIEEVQSHWANDKLDIILVSSNEGLQNLYVMVGEHNRKRLLKTPIVVVSQRAVLLASQLGFKAEIVKAKTARDDDVVEAVERWQAKRTQQPYVENNHDGLNDE